MGQLGRTALGGGWARVPALATLRNRPPASLPSPRPSAPARACRPAPQLPQPATFPSHHRTPFGGLAALLAGALDRAQQGGASYAHVDVLLPGEGQRQVAQQPNAQQREQQPPAAQQAAPQPAQAPAPQREQQPPAALHPAQQPVLLLEDDGQGLSPQQLRRSLGLPSWANAGSGPVAAAAGGSGRSGSGASSGSERSAAPGSSQRTDFQDAALRLGSVALLLTKRQGQGASAGLLSCAAAAGGGAEVLAAAVDWSADGSRCPAAVPGTGAAAAAAATDPTAAWQSALDAICARWPGGASEAWLQEQLGAMPGQGTRLLVAQLRCAGGRSGAAAAQGAYELDWTAGPADIQLAAELPGGSSLGATGLEAGLPGVLTGGFCWRAIVHVPSMRRGACGAVPAAGVRPPPQFLRLPATAPTWLAALPRPVPPMQARASSCPTRGRAAARPCSARCAPT